MPGILYQPVHRREFLRHSMQMLVAGVLVHRLAAEDAEHANQRLHLALLSDTHVAADPKNEYRNFLPWENLKHVLSDAGAARPEALLINGDVARLTGELEDYQAVKGALEPLAENCPIFLGMGNHDSRENFLKVFTPPSGTAQKVPEKHVLLVERPLLRLIMLDSLLFVNKVPGLLGKAQREWLEKYLANSDGRPVLLFVHHTLGDGDGELLDAEAFLRMIEPYSKVKAVFYGHSHEYSYRQRRGIHLINLPAVGYNFSDKEPVGWVDARFGRDGVDLTLRAIAGNMTKSGDTTSLAWRGV